MPNSRSLKDLKLWTPATYRIKIKGYLEESWSDLLAGMKITMSSQGDEEVFATLEGRLKDQTELAGVLNTLYEFRLPLLSVEILSDEEPVL